MQSMAMRAGMFGTLALLLSLAGCSGDDKKSKGDVVDSGASGGSLDGNASGDGTPTP